MTFSRRNLLATLGLALPAVSVLAAEANAASSTPATKHKPTHSSSTKASHKSHHKAATHPAAPTEG